MTDPAIPYGVVSLIEPSAAKRLEYQAFKFLVDRTSEDHVRRRWAYPATQGEATNAFSVAIKIPGGGSYEAMPGFTEGDLPPLLKDVSVQVANILRLHRGRMMLSMNFYRNGSPGIARHYDGDWFRCQLHEDRLFVESGIRPEHVAVLTLSNNNLCGGTQLYLTPGGKPCEVRCAPGELLIFDNIALEHGATAIRELGESANVLRSTLSWRSIDEKCYIIRGNEASKASWDATLELHQIELGRIR